MAIREEIVTSAVNFLEDPNVASSPLENKISFLRSKNLTQEEIDTALARAGSPSSSVVSAPSQAVARSAQPQLQPYYGQQYQQPPPYGWQPPPPPPPRRDWRDWFIMATVMAGVGSGLYFITKRYVYPLVAPPTPEKLDQDKTAVDEQFEKAFATLEQLSKDTEMLKTSEQERTQKLDTILDELETFVRDTKSASRRQDDEADRLRDEMKALKDVIPKSMTAHKDFTDEKLREISNEVRSLKSLIGQRMSSAGPASSNTSAFLKPAGGNATPANATSPAPASAVDAKEADGDDKVAAPVASPQVTRQDYMSSLGGRSSPFGNGTPTGNKSASIPAWQLAMANKDAGSAGGSQQEAGSSS